MHDIKEEKARKHEPIRYEKGCGMRTSRRLRSRKRKVAEDARGEDVQVKEVLLKKDPAGGGWLCAFDPPIHLEAGDSFVIRGTLRLGED